MARDVLWGECIAVDSDLINATGQVVESADFVADVATDIRGGGGGQVSALADLDGVAVQRQGCALPGEHEVHPGVDVGRRAGRLQNIRGAIQGHPGVRGGRERRVARPRQQLDRARAAIQGAVAHRAVGQVAPAFDGKVTDGRQRRSRDQLAGPVEGCRCVRIIDNRARRSASHAVDVGPVVLPEDVARRRARGLVEAPVGHQRGLGPHRVVVGRGRRGRRRGRSPVQGGGIAVGHIQAGKRLVVDSDILHPPGEVVIAVALVGDVAAEVDGCRGREIGPLGDLHPVAVQGERHPLTGEREVHPGVDVRGRAGRLKQVRGPIQRHGGVGGGREASRSRSSQQLEGAATV